MPTSAGPAKKIILLRPRGFCAGVVRAIDVVKIALAAYGAPIYVRKEIVHNRHVVEELRAAGAIFVEELTEVKPEWLENIRTVAVTAGASAPENLVEALVASLQERGFGELEEMEIKEEDVRFNLPAELVKVAPAAQSVARV